jgi:hypothetical protein
MAQCETTRHKGKKVYVEMGGLGWRSVENGVMRVFEGGLDSVRLGRTPKDEEEKGKGWLPGGRVLQCYIA